MEIPVSESGTISKPFEIRIPYHFDVLDYNSIQNQDITDPITVPVFCFTKTID
jgi:hypothetical protein